MAPKGDVPANGVAEQKDILGDVPHVFSQGSQSPFFQRSAVQLDAPVVGIHHPCRKLKDGGFPASRSPRDPQGFPWIQLEMQILQGLDPRLRIGPADAFKAQGRGLGKCRRSPSIVGVHHRGLRMQEVQNACHGCLCFLDQGRHPAYGCKRPSEEIDVKHELENVSQFQIS